MEEHTIKYRGCLFIIIACLFLGFIIYNFVKMTRINRRAMDIELPSTMELSREDSQLFTPNSIGKIEVLNTWKSKIINPLSITTFENKFCLLIHRLDIASGFSIMKSIEVSDLDTTPTDLVLYRTFEFGNAADINFGQIIHAPISKLFLAIRGNSLEKTMENDSIESYHTRCRSLYIGFSSKDTLDLYLTSDPISIGQNEFSATIIFWKKGKSLYLLIMFPLSHSKSIDDEEMMKMLLLN